MFQQVYCSSIPHTAISLPLITWAGHAGHVLEKFQLDLEYWHTSKLLMNLDCQTLATAIWRSCWRADGLNFLLALIQSESPVYTPFMSQSLNREYPPKTGTSATGHMGRIGETEWNCRTGALSEEIVFVRIRSEVTEEVRRSLGDWAMRNSLLREGRCQFTSWDCSLHHPLSHPGCDTEHWDSLKDYCHLPALSCPLAP